MERNEVIISDFSAAVQEKESLSVTPAPDRWEVVPYGTAAVSGKLLLAGPMEHPAPRHRGTAADRLVPHLCVSWRISGQLEQPRGSEADG